jgi:hypothetical protein
MDIAHIPRHPPAPGPFGAIFGPIEAHCNEIRLAADCAGSQIVGPIASTR